MSFPLPGQTQTLYAELLDRLAAEGARRSVGKAPGTFTTKTVSGETYLYPIFGAGGEEPAALSRQEGSGAGTAGPAL